MAKPYSQDLRDRVIEAVERGKMSPPSGGSSLRDQRIRGHQVAGAPWSAKAREPVGHGGHRASKLMPHRDLSGGRARGRNRTSRFRLCAIACRPSAGSKPTPR